jgi:hypothetical protein
MVALTVFLSNERLEGRILKKMHERIIKNFIGIIIMAELRDGPLSGYDVISYIYNKFNLLVSSGTVYSLCTPSKGTALSKELGMKEKEPINSLRKAKKQ